MYKLCAQKSTQKAKRNEKQLKKNVANVSFFDATSLLKSNQYDLLWWDQSYEIITLSMLKALFSSNTRIKLLNTFLLNPEDEYFIRELTRKLDEQINSIRRELDNLKKIGLLKSRVRNRKKYYYLNADFILYSELRDIFIKANSNDKQLVKKISKMGKVELLLLTGTFVKRQSSIDLLLVGEVDKKELQKYLSTFSKDKSELKFSLMTREDFLYRVECNDKFVHDLLKDERSLILIDKLKIKKELLS